VQQADQSVREAEHREGRNAYIYDADAIDSREVFALFVNVTPAHSRPPTGGRGEMRVTRHADQDYVIRHYHRGGKFARVTQDRYLWNGLDLSRPWREWRLLAELYAQGLPVPRPLAAKLTRHGVIYRADLATARLPADGPLAELLLRVPLAESVWQKIGRVIWDFHACGVCHADLNASNIVLADGGTRIWLLDFDKAERRALAHAWQRANLERLKRSLDKVCRENPQMNFTPHEWHCLFSAYSKASNTK
jgi:3-deoxy-D-manno-octulosonic acid kinase